MIIMFFISFIYIPIWLDLLCVYSMSFVFLTNYLHSNMVRFIMDLKPTKIANGNFIYIPIWLDLLYSLYSPLPIFASHLHSNMVRFIMRRRRRCAS